jgi:protein-glutamine gamma-glutamyltransferase
MEDMARADASAAVSVERFFQFALLGLVASGFLAVAGSGYLDAPTIWLTAAGLLLRGLMVCGLVRLDFSERAITILTAVYAAFFLVDFFVLSHELLRSAVHLVFFLAVLKVLTAKAARDHGYVAAIALLELLAAALLSIDFNFFLSLALYLLFAMAALTSGEIRRSIERSQSTARGGLKRFHPRLAMLSIWIAVGILALTAGLFFILPRTADAALSRLARRVVIPGFTDEVSLGAIGEIKKGSRAVMHVSIFSDGAPGALKWRGAALADFDGRRWSNVASKTTRIAVEDGHASLESAAGRGRYLNYHVDFDALDAKALFFAGTPEKIDVRERSLVRGAEGNYALEHRPPPGFHYDAWARLQDSPESSPPFYPPPVLRLEERERYLQLPHRLDPRIAALAHSMTALSATDLGRARALENALRGDYGYSLELPDREIPDPLADFLFTRKKGYCEYFSSAMAVMLRTVGIPSRLVTGFQSGEYNPMTQLWVISASDAHSWVEAWIPGHGWSTFDPTPSDPNAGSFALFNKLGLYLDAAETFWKDWVVGYDMGRQGSLADRVEEGARRMGIRWFDAVTAVESGWQTWSAAVTKRVLIRAAVAIGAGLWIWLLIPPLIRLLRIRRRVQRVRRGQADMGDATLLYARMLRALKRRGYQKPAWYTPVEFAASLPPGGLGATVAEFTAAYNALRFGGRNEAAPQLSTLLDRLERSK